MFEVIVYKLQEIEINSVEIMLEITSLRYQI